MAEGISCDIHLIAPPSYIMTPRDGGEDDPRRRPGARLNKEPWPSRGTSKAKVSDGRVAPGPLAMTSCSNILLLNVEELI